MNTTQSPPQAETPRHPFRRSDLTVHELDGEALAFDAVSGDTHRFNSTALFIWCRCDGTRDVLQIAHRVAEVYDISLEVAVEHVKRIIDEFDKRRLFTNSTDPSHGTGDA